LNKTGVRDEILVSDKCSVLADAQPFKTAGYHAQRKPLCCDSGLILRARLLKVLLGMDAVARR
jgi:hypothetical protein